MPSRPVPLEQLIGAPLRSLVLGQGIAAETTTDFIASLGFVSEAGQTAHPRVIEFTYIHPVPDPATPGQVIDTPTRVRVPLLTLTHIPSIRIAEATVSFGADIVDMRRSERRNVLHTDTPGTPEVPPDLQIVAAYAPSAGTGAALQFSIKVEREPAPTGLGSVLHLLNEAITSRPEAGADARSLSPKKE